MPKIKSVDFKRKIMILRDKYQKMAGLKVTPSAASVIFSSSANYGRCMSCAVDGFDAGKPRRVRQNRNLPERGRHFSICQTSESTSLWTNPESLEEVLRWVIFARRPTFQPPVTKNIPRPTSNIARNNNAMIRFCPIPPFIFVVSNLARDLSRSVNAPAGRRPVVA